MQKVLRLELLMADSTGWAQTHLWEKEAVRSFIFMILSFNLEVKPVQLTIWHYLDDMKNCR